MLNVFITGVENNKNKNFVVGGLSATMQSLGYSCGVYKPIETGVINKSNDLMFIKNIDSFINTYFTYQLEEELSPILSAAKEGLVMEKEAIIKDYQKIKNKDECLIVDGLFGLTTPISKNFLEEDIIKILDLPLLLVVSAKMSDINNTILAVNRARELNIDLRGVIINDYPQNTDNEDIKMMSKLIEEYTGTEVLGILPEFISTINPSDLITEILNKVNIEKIFKIKISKLSG